MDIGKELRVIEVEEQDVEEIVIEPVEVESIRKRHSPTTPEAG